MEGDRWWGDRGRWRLGRSLEVGEMVKRGGEESTVERVDRGRRVERGQKAGEGRGRRRRWEDVGIWVGERRWDFKKIHLQAFARATTLPQ
jgi:hypothetical protein